MKFKNLFLITIILIIASAGCSFGVKKAQAEAVLKQFMEQRIKKNKKIMAHNSEKYYAKIFWDNTSKDKWDTILRLVNKVHGNVTSYEVVSWFAKSQAGTNAGNFVKFQVKTVYQKGSGVETLVFYAPGSSAKYKITSHNFNSKGIQKAIERGIKKASY